MRRRLQTMLLGLVLTLGACTAAEGARAGAVGWDAWRGLRGLSGLCDDAPPAWVPRPSDAGDAPVNGPADASAD